MSSTIYYKKDMNTSSRMTKAKNGSNTVEFSEYSGSNKGGVTYKSKNTITRLNKRGLCIGRGFKTGKTMTYIGKNGKATSRITSF